MAINCSKNGHNKLCKFSSSYRKAPSHHPITIIIIIPILPVSSKIIFHPLRLPIIEWNFQRQNGEDDGHWIVASKMAQMGQLAKMAKKELGWVEGGKAEDGSNQDWLTKMENASFYPTICGGHSEFGWHFFVINN